MPAGPLHAQVPHIPNVGHLSMLFICQSLPSRAVMNLPFIGFTTMLSGIFVSFMSSVYPLMMYIFPSLFLVISPRWEKLSSVTTRTPMVKTFPVASFHTSIVVDVVLDYDQQLRQPCSTSPLLKIFCSSNYPRHI
jgi:hypothetical protein